MSGATYDTDTLRLMTVFENMTHTSPKDCIVDGENNCVYFVVQEGKAGAAIGKNGTNVKHVQSAIKKDIKIFEFSSDIKTFVKNIIPQANDIDVREENGEKIVQIKVDRGSKAMIIGRDGRNIKLFKELLQRNHNVNDLMVR